MRIRELFWLSDSLLDALLTALVSAAPSNGVSTLIALAERERKARR